MISFLSVGREESNARLDAERSAVLAVGQLRSKDIA